MKRTTQRDMMRRLYHAHRGNDDQVVRAYASAELKGEVPRRSNSHGLDAETYARALLADSRRQGWADSRRQGWLDGYRVRRLSRGMGRQPLGQSSSEA
jgi:hypothetical protein